MTTQHTCWNCSAKVPRLPEDIARGQANTDAVGRGEAMPRPYEVGVHGSSSPTEGLEPAPCGDCRGTGYVSNHRDSLPCARCGGRGAEPPPGMAGPVAVEREIVVGSTWAHKGTGREPDPTDTVGIDDDLNMLSSLLVDLQQSGELLRATEGREALDRLAEFTRIARTVMPDVAPGQCPRCGEFSKRETFNQAIDAVNSGKCGLPAPRGHGGWCQKSSGHVGEPCFFGPSPEPNDTGVPSLPEAIEVIRTHFECCGFQQSHSDAFSVIEAAVRRVQEQAPRAEESVFSEANKRKAWDSAMAQLRADGVDVDALLKQGAENIAKYHRAPQAEAATGELYVPKVGDDVRVVRPGSMRYVGKTGTVLSVKNGIELRIHGEEPKRGEVYPAFPAKCVEPIAPATPREQCSKVDATGIRCAYDRGHESAHLHALGRRPGVNMPVDEFEAFRAEGERHVALAEENFHEMRRQRDEALAKVAEHIAANDALMVANQSLAVARDQWREREQSAHRNAQLLQREADKQASRAIDAERERDELTAAMASNDACRRAELAVTRELRELLSTRTAELEAARARCAFSENELRKCHPNWVELRAHLESPEPPPGVEAPEVKP